jgi:hypothetical protein
MGFNNQSLVVMVPAARVDEFNAIMQRHGYGAAVLAKTDVNAVIASNGKKADTATHYILEVQNADSGFVAAAQRAFTTVNAKVSAAAKGSLSKGLRGRPDKSPKVNAKGVLTAAGKKTKEDRPDVAVIVKDKVAKK